MQVHCRPVRQRRSDLSAPALGSRNTSAVADCLTRNQRMAHRVHGKPNTAMADPSASTSAMHTAVAVGSFQFSAACTPKPTRSLHCCGGGHRARHFLAPPGHSAAAVQAQHCRLRAARAAVVLLAESSATCADRNRCRRIMAQKSESCKIHPPGSAQRSWQSRRSLWSRWANHKLKGS